MNMNPAHFELPIKSSQPQVSLSKEISMSLPLQGIEYSDYYWWVRMFNKFNNLEYTADWDNYRNFIYIGHNEIVTKITISFSEDTKYNGPIPEIKLVNTTLNFNDFYDIVDDTYDNLENGKLIPIGTLLENNATKTANLLSLWVSSSSVGTGIFLSGTIHVVVEIFPHMT